MGRKDLSRTVIEGGRYFHNCWQRRASHGRARARTREWLAHVEDDLDEAEASVPEPLAHVGKMFRDKLAPAYRWIDSQVGRPWAKVRSELFARFDPRTIAGQHVLFDHMLGEVLERGRPRPGRHQDWFVDAHGILRRARWLGRDERQLTKAILARRGDRRAVLLDRGWWWIALERIGERCVSCYRGKPHAKGDHVVRYVASGPLTRGDVRFLRKLPAWGYELIAISREAAGLSPTLRPRA